MFPFHPTKLDRVHAEALASTAPFSLWLAASFEGPARPAPVDARDARDPKNAQEGGDTAPLLSNKGFSYQGGRGTPRDLSPR